MVDLDAKFFAYLTEKGFDERWFFYASVQNLLLYVVNGFCNENVAVMVGMEEVYVMLTCQHFLGFDGWKEDLDYSPWYRYKNSLLTNEEESDIIKVCEKYKEYKKELEDYYDRDTLA